MIPMIVIVLFYAPAFLPFVSLIVAIYTTFKLGKVGYEIGLEQHKAFERAYNRFTDRLLATRLIPSF